MFKFLEFLTKKEIGTDIEKIQKIIENGKEKRKLKYIGSGCTAQVYSYNNYAVKVYKKVKGAKRDIMALNILGNSEYYPSMHAYEENKYLIVDYIEGYTIRQISEIISTKKDAISDIILKSNYKEQIKNALKLAIENNLCPHDMTENNIVMKLDGSIVVIDTGAFEYSPEDCSDNRLLSAYSKSLFDNSSFKIIDEFLDEAI